MAHHGNDIPDEHKQDFYRLLREQEKIKDTFPEGKLNAQDEGALAIQIGYESNKVIMQFGEPTAWIGFTPEQAVALAESLIQKAKAAGLKSIVSINL